MDQEGWQKFVIEFNRKLERKEEEFMEELWGIVVGFGVSILMGTGLDKEAREELLSKMIHIRETRPNTEPRSSKDSSTLQIENKKVKTKSEDQDKPFIIARCFVIHETREGEAGVG